MSLTIGKKRNINLTSGPIFFPLLSFILPLLAETMLHEFYHAADVMVVGLSTNPDAVGAVGAPASYLALIRTLFIGFSVGSAVVIARFFGANDKEGVSGSIHTSVCMGAIFGIIGAVAGIIAARPVMIAMGYSGEILRLGLRYSYIYLACLPFLALTNMMGAIYRAKGNSQTPFLVLSGTGILNVALNLVFVLVFKMSVEGVAIATAVANFASAAILLYLLAIEKDESRLYFKKLRIDKEHFVNILKISVPASLQTAMFSISNILISSSIVQVNDALTPIGSAYAPVIKGNVAAGGIEAFLFTTTSSVTTASSTFTSQNVGVHNYRRVKKIFFQLCLIGTVISLFFSLLAVLLHKPLLSLYGVKDAEDILSTLAYSTAFKRMLYKWPTFILLTFMNICAGTIRGLGKSTVSAMISFVGTCVFRVVWIFTVFKTFSTVDVIYLSYPVTWLVTGAFFALTLFILLKRRIKKHNSEAEATFTKSS